MQRRVARVALVLESLPTLAHDARRRSRRADAVDAELLGPAGSSRRAVGVGVELLETRSDGIIDGSCSLGVHFRHHLPSFVELEQLGLGAGHRRQLAGCMLSPPAHVLLVEPAVLMVDPLMRRRTALAPALALDEEAPARRRLLGGCRPEQLGRCRPEVRGECSPARSRSGSAVGGSGGAVVLGAVAVQALHSRHSRLLRLLRLLWLLAAAVSQDEATAHGVAPVDERQLVSAGLDDGVVVVSAVVRKP